MKKYTTKELFLMDAADVYKMVLKGDSIKKFPKGFWQQPEAKQNAFKCTDFLIKNILRYDDEMIKQKNSYDLFTKNKLSGMLQYCFNGSAVEAINTTYSNNFKQEYFKNYYKQLSKQ